MVLCFNELGCGEAALRKFSAIMAIPGLAHNTYRRLSKKVGSAHREVTANILTAAVRAVSDAYTHDRDNEDSDADLGDADGDMGVADGDVGDADGDVGDADGDVGAADSDVGGVDGDVGDADGDVGDADGDSVRGSAYGGESESDSDSSGDSDGGEDNPDGIVDVTVSFDGTWHKRGFTSNYGVGIIIDVMTGLVLDFEVLSKHCQACALNSKREMTDVEREMWRREHAPNCEKNYEGSSKGMEKEAAVRMWRRSVERNGMRYTKMLSDGDSVAYKAVCDLNLYPVKKLECVNHCDKRMGTALRKKAKEAKLGGRRRGALTIAACNILQSYYRNAIIQNLGNPGKMREAIWASYLHCCSTDDNPQHQNCPRGPDTWCFFNKAVADGRQPPAHKDHVGTPLSEDVARAIKPIYERMSNLALMEKIKHGRTQNANECVNGQIWAKCPKTVHVGAGRFNASVASAVSHFNQEYVHLSQVMKKIGATPSHELRIYQERQDSRCSQAEEDCVPAKKRARKQHKRDKKNTTRALEKKEGQTYGPGML
ncbi:uncharacterized protein LOC143289180 [Babylonia areolata]|uniref:uncharacterized protein LOC143289180 n=1 Tax=Babylonia areolata TaxID=304850 RepID=UPI003FD0C20D